MSEYIHEYFGLTYGNYLVLPRSILQSMPDEWQWEFVKMMNELTDRFGYEWEPKGGYTVLALDENKKFTSDSYSNYERGRRKIPEKGK